VLGKAGATVAAARCARPGRLALDFLGLVLRRLESALEERELIRVEPLGRLAEETLEKQCQLVAQLLIVTLVPPPVPWTLS